MFRAVYADKYAAEFCLTHQAIVIVDADMAITGDLVADAVIVKVYRLEATTEVDVYAGHAAALAAGGFRGAVVAHASDIEPRVPYGGPAAYRTRICIPRSGLNAKE